MQHVRKGDDQDRVGTEDRSLVRVTQTPRHLARWASRTKTEGDVQGHVPSLLLAVAAGLFGDDRGPGLLQEQGGYRQIITSETGRRLEFVALAIGLHEGHLGILASAFRRLDDVLKDARRDARCAEHLPRLCD